MKKVKGFDNVTHVHLQGGELFIAYTCSPTGFKQLTTLEVKTDTVKEKLKMFS